MVVVSGRGGSCGGSGGSCSGGSSRGSTDSVVVLVIV